ncbi:UDP-glycosyltransferase 83A1-like [Durio zibethinus]|uniref:UDP-glycosyltransferase 83A1-like n=1 Tax=Durio zibethinus TaxID=66656 RepID=A0A6P5YA45_DURZI|nr:UDP-glycosyltransferase 83A1-like [Durio zibethinus]
MPWPHVLVISYPAQGHVAPLLKLSLQIALQGVEVTFVNTKFIHEKFMVSMPEKDKEQSLISLVSIPDGLDRDDRNDVFKLAESIGRVMPEWLRRWELEPIAFWPAGAACFALSVHIPQLIDAQVIDNEGTLMKETFLLSKNMPAWSSSDIAWNSPTLKLIPNILPVAPLLASNRSGAFAGNCWPEDSTCLKWLDKQTADYVIYVAFGGTTILSVQQSQNRYETTSKVAFKDSLYFILCILDNFRRAKYCTVKATSKILIKCAKKGSCRHPIWSGPKAIGPGPIGFGLKPIGSDSGSN